MRKIKKGEYMHLYTSGLCNFSCAYKVTYIKKVDDSLYHIFNILNHYNDASTSDLFMEQFNKHYTLNYK